MPKATDMVHCKHCKQEVLWGELRRHQRDVHGMTHQHKPRHTPIAMDATQTFQQIRTLAKEMIIQIDDERNRIQKRLIELDDMAAKYKSLV